jgi:hypothetical protein
MGPNDTIPAQAPMKPGDWSSRERTREQLERMYGRLNRKLFVYEALELFDHPAKVGEIRMFMSLEDQKR